MKRTILTALFLFISLVFVAPTAFGASQSAKDAALRAKIEKAIKQTQKNLRDINVSVQGTSEKIALLEAELTQLRSQELALKATLSEYVQKHHLAMANLARLERQPLRAMLTDDIFKVQPQREPILAISRKALNNSIEQNRQQLADLLKITHEKELHQQALKNAENQLKEHRQNLAELEAKQHKLLSLPPKERRRLEAQSRKIAKQGDINKLLELTNALTGVLATPKGATAPSNLPVDGVVITTFRAQNAKTGIASNGLEIEGISGQKVVAAKDGRILYAGPFKGFGFLIIMEHEKGVHSLYGGIGQNDYTTGDFVTAGRQIGALPEHENPALYLEVRQDGMPIDPQSWLNKG